MVEVSLKSDAEIYLGVCYKPFILRNCESNANLTREFSPDGQSFRHSVVIINSAIRIRDALNNTHPSEKYSDHLADVDGGTVESYDA